MQNSIEWVRRFCNLPDLPGCCVLFFSLKVTCFGDTCSSRVGPLMCCFKLWLVFTAFISMLLPSSSLKSCLKSSSSWLVRGVNLPAFRSISYIFGYSAKSYWLGFIEVVWRDLLLRSLHSFSPARELLRFVQCLCHTACWRIRVFWACLRRKGPR